jgi:tungstate transport system substrate-binding protein
MEEKMEYLKKILCVSAVFIIAMTMAGFAGADSCRAVYGTGSPRFRLATGSPGELGLLEKLADAFNETHGTSMCWIKAGSGRSLNLLHSGKVDIIMVHAPAAEKKAVKAGWAVKRTLIGSNEFYIVGPKNDPAGISNAKSASDAYAMIAHTESKFFSRGDNSGTNKKELAIWKKAGIVPSGSWYIITGDFMMATLKRADREKGYFMTDSSTWVAGRSKLGNLKILFRGDPVLINTYHGLCRPADGSGIQKAASSFIDFLSSDQGQKIIRDYGKDAFGQGMYNDAEYAGQYDH